MFLITIPESLLDILNLFFVPWIPLAVMKHTKPPFRIMFLNAYDMHRIMNENNYTETQ